MKGGKINKMKNRKMLAVLMLGVLALSLTSVIALDRQSSRSSNAEFAEELDPVFSDLREQVKAEAESLRDLDREGRKARLSEIRSSSDLESVASGLIPESSDSAASLTIAPDREPHRFILWTNTGEQVMWGQFGNGYFFGEDNQGVETWGIYYQGYFAGFYGEEFFQGRYRGQFWKAEGLFGLDQAHGQFKTFPSDREDRPRPRSMPINRIRHDFGGKAFGKPSALN
tara:strand:+ start:5861 stop:6541 length:681 start_codon:yes stop_codon:yes gene_type:complete